MALSSSSYSSDRFDRGLNDSNSRKHNVVFRIAQDEAFGANAIAVVNKEFIAISDSTEMEFHFFHYRELKQIVRNSANEITIKSCDGNKHNVYFQAKNPSWPGEADHFISTVRKFVPCKPYYYWIEYYYAVRRIKFNQIIPSESINFDYESYYPLFAQLSATNREYNNNKLYVPFPLEYYAQVFLGICKCDCREDDGPVCKTCCSKILYAKNIAKFVDDRPPFHFHCTSRPYCRHVTSIKALLHVFDPVERNVEDGE